MSESKKENTKYALCYIPIFAMFIFFVEDNKSDQLKKHIKYAIYLLIVYLVLTFLLGWFMGAFLFVMYLGISGYLAYKAYNGENIKIEMIDDLEKKIKDKM